ncbi:MAG TPA: hypothetical protein VGR48_17865 [Terriglobales bacterium]|nr:hypothetical protein [Terriglobales bacterium]
MSIRIILIASFFSLALSWAQNVRDIDLTGVPEKSDPRVWSTYGKYMICGTEEAKNSHRAVRVSLESLSPTTIRPLDTLSVRLKVENDGKLAVVLPASPRITDFQAERDFPRYTAILPIGAGLPSGGTTMGWLELYGSPSEPNTTVTLRPGEWITVRGEIRVRHWFAPEEPAKASFELQLFELSPRGSEATAETCVKQVSGGSIPIQFQLGSRN